MGRYLPYNNRKQRKKSMGRYLPYNNRKQRKNQWVGIYLITTENHQLIEGVLTCKVIS
jgi:hypothetical protein